MKIALLRFHVCRDSDSVGRLGQPLILFRAETNREFISNNITHPTNIFGLVTKVALPTDWNFLPETNF